MSCKEEKNTTDTSESSEGRAPWHRHLQGGGWVHNSARVEATVRVEVGAWVEQYASVSGHAQVLDHASVGGYARVGDCATIGGGARVAGYAVVHGQAIIEGRAYIGGQAHVQAGRMTGGCWTKTPLCVLGPSYSVNEDGERGALLTIRDTTESRQWWKENFRQWAARLNISPDDVEEYRQIIDFLNEMYASHPDRGHMVYWHEPQA